MHKSEVRKQRSLASYYNLTTAFNSLLPPLLLPSFHSPLPQFLLKPSQSLGTLKARALGTASLTNAQGRLGVGFCLTFRKNWAKWGLI